MREMGSFKMLKCAYGKHCISKMTKEKRLNNSTAQFLYAVLACIFDQILQVVCHIHFQPLKLNWKLF